MIMNITFIMHSIKNISTMLSDRLIVMYICYDVMEIMMVMHIMDVIMHKRVVWL